MVSPAPGPGEALLSVALGPLRWLRLGVGCLRLNASCYRGLRPLWEGRPEGLGSLYSLSCLRRERGSPSGMANRAGRHDSAPRQDETSQVPKEKVRMTA